MKKKISITQVIRHIIQLIMFILFPGLFITTFLAVRDIYTAVIEGSFNVSAYSDQLLLMIAIFPITILFGRFFCGNLCSFGAMGDLLWWISSKIIKKPITVNAKTDRVLKWLKYVILLFIVVFLWTLALPLDSTYNPWNVFGMYSTPKGWTNATALISVGGLLLLLIIIGDILIERFFCRYICPLGAIFAVLSHFRLHRIKKPSDNCGACQLCTLKCSMGIQLKEMDSVKSGECIDCYRCVEVCPRENITTTPSPAVAGTVAALGITGLYYAGTLVAPKPNNVQTDSVVAGEASASQTTYEDGVYTGIGSGFRGNISVEVTVGNGLITNITIVSSDDDMEFFNLASNSIIPQIISTQSVDVDTVSGATFSSNGIIEAVANALDIEMPDNNSEKESEKKEPFNGDESGKKEPFNDDNSKEEEPDNSTSQSNNNSTTELDLSQISDGEYNGTGTGFRGDVSVTVKVENHSITSITIESYQDDEKYFASAKDTIISEIISNQNLNVDTVSGATFSSNGIIEAVANALNVSYSNPNSANPQRGHGGKEHGGKGPGGKGHGDRHHPEFEDTEQTLNYY